MLNIKSDRDQGDQERILANLQAIADKANAGLMTPSEIKDQELMNRIEASSEGDNLEARVKLARFEARAEELEQNARFKTFERGENEEQFLAENEDKQKQFIRLRNSAMRQALSELKAGKI